MKGLIPPRNSESSRAPGRLMVGVVCLATILGGLLFIRPEGRDGLRERIEPTTPKGDGDRAGDHSEFPTHPPFAPLATVPPPSPFEAVSRRVQGEVAEMVTESGFAGSATEIAGDYEGSPAEQRIALEAVIAAWAESDRPAAVEWIAQHAGHVSETATRLEPGLWDAAVGGYIEGVVRKDPDSAVIGAELLEPQTPAPIGNAQNRARIPDVPETDHDPQNPTGLPAIVADVTTPPEVSVDGVGTTVTPTDGLSTSERRRLFPGDPGYPGDPDFLVPGR